MAGDRFLMIPSALLLFRLLMQQPAALVRGDVPPGLNACPELSPFPACRSFLYVVPRGLSRSEVAERYAANVSLIRTISRNQGAADDFLVEVPCACQTANITASGGGMGNITALFHDAIHMVNKRETGDIITGVAFAGLALEVPEKEVIPGRSITVWFPCGCWTAPTEGRGGEEEVVAVTYVVQANDTLTSIGNLLNTDVEAITAMNRPAVSDPNYLVPGQRLFVPMGAHTLPLSSPPPSKEKEKTAIIIFLSVSISVMSIVLGALLLFFFHLRRRSSESAVESCKGNLSKTQCTKAALAAFESQLLACKNIEGTSTFQSERPLIFSLEEVDAAASSFDESRKIGEGGYGSVYYGVLASKEVAIKKMKSNKSKEFLAELNVLCKVHHRNVVELIGYAAGDDHLYLVYEYVHNGSLYEHLHDPLLKGHQPLSWTARAHIALDTARGIEYIHDHTKATYVHRDIKTSNILLDSAMRAKVADFGLVKLLEHSDEEEEGWQATRLVGTPGYLPPESVRELQMTTKSDVFAFGVVVSELITGQRALIPDRKDSGKMRSLVTIMKGIFLLEDPKAAMEEMIDKNLNNTYPADEVHKMVDIAMWCLCDDPVSRPQMREITSNLAQILMASIEWEASLGGNSQVFSGIFNGR